MRIPLAVASYTFAIVILALLQLIPGTGALQVPFSGVRFGHSNGLVTVLLSFGYAVSAILLIPSGVRRGAVAVGVLGIYLASFSFNDIAALSGVGTDVVVPLRFLLPVAALCAAWLIARRRSRLSWAALALLVLTIPWNMLVHTLAEGARLAVITKPGGIDPTLMDVGEGVSSLLTIILGLGFPVLAILVVAALLDRDRGSRRDARAAARDEELAALNALPQTQTEPLAVVALVLGFLVPPAGPIVGYLAHQRIRARGGRGWQLATAGSVVGYVGIALWTTLWATVALVLTGFSNGSLG